MKDAYKTNWLLQRKKGIGGSDAAAVLGESHWKTPYEVYCDKINDSVTESKEGEDNIPMLIGTACEPYIREEYERITGRKVATPSWKQHETIPYIVGTVDGIAEDRVVEIKTARTEWEEVPAYYYLQVQHYMMLYGLQKADVVALFLLNYKVRIYEIEANIEVQEQMKKIYAAFWHKVETRTPPEPTTPADIRKIYPFDNGNSIELSQNSIKSIQEIAEIKRNISELETVLENAELAVQKELGENQIGTDNAGNVLVTWKTSKSRELIDAARLKKEEPETYQRYVKLSKPSRVFKIKEQTK